MTKIIQSWRIFCLSNATSQIDNVAKWHHEECLNQGLDSTYERRRERLGKHLLMRPAPRTWIALSNDVLCGCISLVSYHVNTQAVDWDSHSPLWLSNLYVPKKFRCCGIGQSLVEKTLSYAKELSQSEVWLMATEKTLFYQKRDWLIVRKARVAGRVVSVMRKSI